MSAGVDYGHGLANIDHQTGIRYGVISPHSLSGDSLDEVYQRGENLTHWAAVEEARTTLAEHINRGLDTIGFEDVDKERLYEYVEGIWGDVEDRWNDRYEEQDDTYRYEQDGYVLETSSLGIYVIRSPYYTRARFCSPCCPGAGDLDGFDEDGEKTYCLGHEWFEEETAPYRVWSVETGEELVRP